MRSRPQRLIAALLAMLMGLLPIQGVGVSVVVSLDSKQGRVLQHDSCHGELGSVVTEIPEVVQTCEHCVGNSCDPSSDCNTAQCVSGAPAIVSFFSFPEMTADSIASVNSQQPARRSPTALFRPPRT